MGLEEYRGKVREQIGRQRDFFAGGESKGLEFRKRQLEALGEAVKKYEQEVLEALRRDLNKSPEEGFLTEVGMVGQEIKMHIRRLRKWAKSRRVSTPMHLWPSKSYVVTEPLGVVLIMSPWNYPFQLLMNPLIGAISAGDCAVLKPSPLSPATNEVIKKIIGEIFPPEYVCVIEGDGEQTGILLEEAFDFIFFTGSPAFGKVAMRAASVHLTPVVLELGGKSPCIVDCDSNLELAARRIAWGKLMNAGQTCIAPDYLLVHESVEQQLVGLLQRYMTEFYGEDASVSPYYPRIINRNAFMRLKSYLGGGDVVYGGLSDEEKCYISPTILRNVKPGSAVMEEEIFGPILPVLTYREMDEALAYILARPKPLALYYFGKPEKGEEILRKTSSGGACINDVLLHIANPDLPFGGVGNSGMGRYHGEYSFRAFSHERAVLKSSLRLDFPFKYVPFRYFSFVKKWM